MNDRQQLAAMGELMVEQAGRPEPLCMAKRIEGLEGMLREVLALVDGPKWQAMIDERKAHILLGRIDAALSGKLPAPVAPEGWQLVPVEPTRAMREAFHEAHEEWGSGDNWRLDCPDHQWQAMLAAAPKPEVK